MPSIDRLGREFPLSLIGFDEAAALPSPEHEPYEAWFAQAEAFLLNALELDSQNHSHGDELKQLASALSHRKNESSPSQRLYRRAGEFGPKNYPLAAVFSDFSGAESSRVLARTTFWWTIGGPGFEPLAFKQNGLPDGAVFAAMLKGQFVNGSQADLSLKAGTP
jgi:type VI secretion system protein ImpM